MAIVKSTACDMVPKAITLYIINKLKEYIKSDLHTLMHLHDEKLVSSIKNGSTYNTKQYNAVVIIQAEWLGVDPNLAAKFKRKEELRDAYKKAIEIIRMYLRYFFIIKSKAMR